MVASTAGPAPADLLAGVDETAGEAGFSFHL
jgi:hypothetical protein